MRALPLLLALVLPACSQAGPNAESSTKPAAASSSTEADAPKAEGAMREVDVATLKADLESGSVPVLIDVRTPGEYNQGHVAGAKLVPLDQLGQRLSELEAHKDGEIYVICQSGNRSGRASQYLASKGYKAVNVAGGTGAWIRSGNPVE